MKLIIIIFVTLASAVSLACPRLSGEYKCDLRKANYEINYSFAGGVFEFEIDNEDFLADNQSYDLNREGITGTYQSYCENKSYYIKQKYKKDEKPNVTYHQYEQFSFIDLYTIRVETIFSTEDGFALKIVDRCELI